MRPFSRAIRSVASPEKNGFNVDEFQPMVATVQQQPEAGKLTFRDEPPGRVDA